MGDSNSRLVYSTSCGPVCPDCSRPREDCICRQMSKTAVPATSGKVRLRYETSGRNGKGVTTISGLPMSRVQLGDLARKLKQKFGTGGAVKDYTVELQGDFREKAVVELRILGISCD